GTFRYADCKSGPIVEKKGVEVIVLNQHESISVRLIQMTFNRRKEPRSFVRRPRLSHVGDETWRMWHGVSRYDLCHEPTPRLLFALYKRPAAQSSLAYNFRRLK
ncbi:MAG: hypothetical protein NTZ72_03250, partial [Afipia sp.]|nr:hypothetical protein [Afipia sp.]